MNPTDTSAQPHHPVVLAEQEERSEDVQLRIADAWSGRFERSPRRSPTTAPTGPVSRSR